MSGCIPPLLVSRLLEPGHGEEVEFQAGRGEWFCAREWARLLGDQGLQEQALEVLAPYVATGWWPAARDGDVAALPTARIPARHRCDTPWCCRGLDPDTAIGLLAAVRERQDRIDTISDLLAEAGRTEEAVTVLRSHASACRGLPAGHLIDLGRVEDAVTLLQQRGSQPAVPVRTGAFPAEPPF
ncbi:hypothetical protein ACFV1B_27210 [Streptomyces sp. NPDC059637]|uniref:hypothetical protein n=1 Tax=Streptomyces sp. NPDC059637 TaxID=3347752 RepID=UPI0036CD4C65